MESPALTSAQFFIGASGRKRKYDPTRPLCRHCKAEVVNRPRGLGWTCYYLPGVRDLYPVTSKYARRGVTNFTGESLPCEPTDALPGTPEKFEVLCRRAAAGQALFHPLDARRPLNEVPSFVAVLLPADPCELEDDAA
jgi:hypothetical protein